MTVGGLSGSTDAQTSTPPPSMAIVTLRITRPAAAPMTVPIVVSDACGPWHTVVGAGAGLGLWTGGAPEGVSAPSYGTAGASTVVGSRTVNVDPCP
jgi:hypothetical protein